MPCFFSFLAPLTFSVCVPSLVWTADPLLFREGSFGHGDVASARCPGRRGFRRLDARAGSGICGSPRLPRPAVPVKGPQRFRDGPATGLLHERRHERIRRGVSRGPHGKRTATARDADADAGPSSRVVLFMSVCGRRVPASAPGGRGHRFIPRRAVGRRARESSLHRALITHLVSPVLMLCHVIPILRARFCFL